MDFAPYVAWMIESTPSPLRRWVSEERLRAELADELARTWAARVDAPGNLQAYAAYCPIAGAEPSDYRLREIELFPGANVLAGIHFFGLRVDLPFIGVEAQSRVLTREEICAASTRLCAEFALFRAREARWWSQDGFELRDLAGARGDQRLVIGHLGEIARAGVPALPQGMTLEPELALDSYDEYVRMHGEFIRAHPEWKGRIQLEDRDSMVSCADSGGLYSLRDGDRLAGVIAARPRAHRGMRGWHMHEEILDTPYRGRGLGPIMQRAFLGRLDRSQAELVFGDIDDRNLASLRTALRSGRVDAGGWVFVPGGEE